MCPVNARIARAAALSARDVRRAGLAGDAAARPGRVERVMLPNTAVARQPDSRPARRVDCGGPREAERTARGKWRCQACADRKAAGRKPKTARPEPATAAVSAEDASSFAAGVVRQVQAGEPDARLLPAEDKARRDCEKRLEKLAERKGWFVFVQGQAHGALVGKAAQRRNCELTLVREVLRWRGDVARLVPGRLADFDRVIGEAAADPKPIPRKSP